MAFVKYLPSQIHAGNEVNRLASALELIMIQLYELDIFLKQAVINFIRLLVVNDNLTGIAYLVPWKNHQKKTIICLLAETIISATPNSKDLSGFINNLDNALQSPDITVTFPQLNKALKLRDIDVNQNVLVAIHQELSFSDGYPHLSADLHLGILELLSNSQEQNPDTLTIDFVSATKGLRRIFKYFTKAEAMKIQTAIQANETEAAFEIISFSARRLTNLKQKKSSFPLSKNTMRDYALNCYYRLVEKSGAGRGIGIPVTIREGRKNEQSIKKQIVDDDDDPPNLLTGDEQKKILKIEDAEKRDRNPHLPFDEQIEVFGQREGKIFIRSEERAVMDHYTDWFGWHNCLHINEVFHLLRNIISLEQSPNSQQTSTILFTLLLTGRSLDWLLSVHLASGNEDYRIVRLDYPVFDLEYEAIFYPPHTFPDIAGTPYFRPGLSEPMSANWVLPLPKQLIPFWRKIIRGCKKGRNIFSCSKHCVQKSLSTINQKIQECIPEFPGYTLSRIRGACISLLILEGDLDPKLTAIVSDQRTLVINASLFYTTIDVSFLAEKYRTSVDLALKKLLSDWNEPLNIPTIKNPKELPSNFLIGSGYLPKLDILQKIITKFIEMIEEEKDDVQKHNLRTYYFLYSLSLLCGLRISEVCNLRVDQFDEVTIDNGHRIRLLVLPKTRSSRYAFAARVVPIPQVLHPMVDNLLSLAPNQSMAFYHFSKGKMVKITKDILDDLDTLLDIQIPRWHAGRHYLGTYLLLNDMPSTGVNAILGHSREGEELFNPYIPGNIMSYWQDYLRLADRLATLLGIVSL